MNKTFLTAVIIAPALLYHALAAAEQARPCTGNQANAPSTTQVEQGRKIALDACRGCHGLDPIVGYSSGEWQAVVRDMQTRGAAVDDAEVPLLAAYLEYLTRNCPGK